MDYNIFYNVMPDGTIKQVNPFTGTEVWTVPGRGIKPMSNGSDESASPLEKHSPEDYCSFCPPRILETAPEKSRLIIENGTYRRLDKISPSDYANTHAVLRRVGNLFEIVSLDYWRKNFGYKISSTNIKWKDDYVKNEIGLQHIIDTISYKLELQGKSEAEIEKLPSEYFLSAADAFFGGGHELIIADRHYNENAQYDDDLFSSGDMSLEYHHQYFAFTIDAMRDILQNNRYVRYISVFQNWLRAAGASFDHLHKQLVALDAWGESIDRQIAMIRKDKNVFNSYGPNFAGHHNLIFAENDFGVAFVGIGHRFPTLEVYSKSINSRPFEHTPEEIRGMSDLVHACHAALGNKTSCNEEWYYAPIDSIFLMPWHINIKLRINISAGFEGGTSIFINPIKPEDLRDRLVPRLYDLRANHRIDHSLRIAEECSVQPNPLQYYKNF